ncbi:hypothetical protein CRG98_011650, partial [Punica granatum]
IESVRWPTNSSYQHQHKSTSFFHVSQLKKAIGDANCSTEAGHLEEHTRRPAAILERKMVKRGNKAAAQVLVHWTNTSPAKATLEYADELRWCFPWFDLGCKGFEGEGNVTG